MNVLDLVIAVLVVTSIGGGWRLGLLTGATSWVLLIQALVLATMVLPPVATTLGGENPGLRLMVAAVLFISSGFAGQRAGIVLGRHFRRSTPVHPRPTPACRPTCWPGSWPAR